MSAPLGRMLLAALLAIAVAGYVYALAMYGGGTGVGLTAPVGRHLVRITVEKGSPGYDAGLRSGDVIDVAAASSVMRWRYVSRSNGGEHLAYYVARSTQIREVNVTARAYNVAADTTLEKLGIAGFGWLLLFAVLIGTRRSENQDARIVAALLAFWTLGGTLYRGNVWIPWVPLSIAADVANKLANTAAVVLLLYFVRRYATPSRLSTAIAWVAYALCALHIVLGGIVEVAAILAGNWAVFSLALRIEASCISVALLLAAAFVVVSLRSVSRSHRSLLAWLTVPLAWLYVAYGILPARIFLDPFFPPGVYAHASDLVYDVLMVIVPLSLTYALFSRRVLDIAFVLNRATIFSVVSLVIVGIFVLAEWLISGWMAGASRSANVIVLGVLALLLGLGIRFVHRRVEGVVDQLLFRKRREGIEAIHRLALEAPYISDRDVLLSRASRAVEEHGGAAFARFLIDDGLERYGDVGVDDPALVSLRARHEPIDLHGVETAVSGERAYPMAARGRLLGVLVVGPKRSGEAYAPDEDRTLAQLAQSLGGALDVLSSRAPSERSEIVERLDAIARMLSSLCAAVEGTDESVAIEKR